MKYLVTGVTGLLGNNIVRALVGAGEQVRVLMRGTSDPRPLEGLNVERDLFHKTFALEDRSEGMAAFIEKRKPANRNR